MHRTIACVVACVCVLAGARIAAGAPPAGEDAVEAYLSAHGLDELLALHLRRRLERTAGPERLEIADRLGKLYASLLEGADTLEDRQLWEGYSRQLLASVPEARTHALRLSIARVRYLGVEGLAEDVRLGLSTPAERDEAKRVLVEVRRTFASMASELDRRVEELERQESRGAGEDWRLLERALTEARRLRSLAMYYAGWSEYYLAFLTGDTSMATAALRHFGWILNAPEGEEPDLEQFTPSMLRYEHIARAAIGAAMCYALRGDVNRAIAWLDAVDVPQAHAEARAQLFSRRLVVLTAARRWADIQRIVQQRAGMHVSAPPERGVAEARLLVVLMLGSLEDGVVLPDARPLVRALAEHGLSRLVEQGEVGHVLSLVERYGTAPIGDTGFIVLYVRGLQAYEKARSLHESSAADASTPTDAAPIANRYVEAAQVLVDAIASTDSERYPKERAKAGLIAGAALYYAKRPVDAADLLEATYRAAPKGAKNEDALWLAIVALDHAVAQGDTSQRPRMHALSALFLERHPGGTRAARLVLVTQEDGLVDTEHAVEILLAIEHDEPLHDAALRRAEVLLYQMYRAAQGDARNFASVRFIKVAREVLDIERRAIEAATSAQAASAAGERAIGVARQMLDAMLGLAAPDTAGAGEMFEVIDSIARRLDMDVAKLAPELAFRHVQVAMAVGDETAMEKWLTQLHAQDGPFARAADRLLYQRAYERWARAPHDADKAVELVHRGLPLMDQFGDDAVALANPTVFTLYDTTASAAASAWRLKGLEHMRDIALAIDEKLLDAGRDTAGVLARFAELAESVGRTQDALDAWRTLLAAYEPGSNDWFEARYQSIRLLAGIDPARARVVMDQHIVLHPDYGPAPWGEELRMLDERLPRTATTDAEGRP